MVQVDLHLHTTYSDGMLTPTQLVRMCARRGLEVISVSDHDTTNGLPEALEAARSYPHLTVIPGIELSSDVPGAEIHVLGYFVDYRDAKFQRTLKKFREERQDRAHTMVEKLNKLGVKITWQRVKELSADATIGRPHIALAMVEAGYVEYPRDAFDRYIGRNGAAYVERVKVTPSQAVSILVDNGAVPVLAHPTYAVAESEENFVAALREVLKDLKVAGLAGMEVYYKDYAPDQVRRLAVLADELGLIPCGGSDYHASSNPGEPEPGTVGPPMETVEALKAIRRQRASNGTEADPIADPTTDVSRC